MRHGKATALKCLPLATELLIVFLTADILWQLLCGRPPFSMWGFLLSGGLMTAGNSLFLQKPRRFWQILLLNVLLCAVWIPLLSRTLDLTYPPLLVIQVPLYLFPLCRGYHWGARRRCRRQSQETPREYLERLAGGPLRDALDAPMQARYSILVDDVERSLYSTLPPRLSREQVRELLSTVHRSARTPPARAK